VPQTLPDGLSDSLGITEFAESPVAFGIGEAFLEAIRIQIGSAVDVCLVASVAVAARCDQQAETEAIHTWHICDLRNLSPLVSQ